MNAMGKWICIAGLILAAVGALILLAEKIPGFGKMPGDIFIKKENFTFYFPLGTCIVISIGVSLVIHFFLRK